MARWLENFTGQRNTGWIAGAVGMWRRHGDFSILLALIVVTGAIWGFAELAEEVLEGETKSFDESVLLAMRTPGDLSDPIGPSYVEETGRDFTALGGIPILTLMTIAVTGYVMFIGKRRVAMVILVASIGALLASSFLKHSFDRTRPDLVPHNTKVYTASFPSGHAMQAAATYLTLGALLAQVQRRRRVRIYIVSLAILITLLVGLSRVYLGVHWPTDVMAGWFAGAAWASFCWLLARWMHRHGQLKNEVEEEVNIT